MRQLLISYNNGDGIMKVKKLFFYLALAVLGGSSLYAAADKAIPLKGAGRSLRPVDKTLPSKDRKVYPVDKIVAVVDNEVITQKELEENLFPIYAEYKNIYKGEELKLKMDEARRKILSRLVDNKLILKEAERVKLELPPYRIDGEIAKFRGNFRNEEEFKEALAARGLSADDLKKRIEEQLKVEYMIDSKVTSLVVVTPTETTGYYKDHLKEFKVLEMLRLRSLLINAEDGDAAALAAEETLKKFRQKEEFSSVAEELSGNTKFSCTQDSRWVKRGEMKPDIEKLIFALGAGEYSNVVESALGYYIFKVEEKRPAKTREFREVEIAIKNIIYHKKVRKRYAEWIDGLKENV